jgi:hypothetical protein
MIEQPYFRKEMREQPYFRKGMREQPYFRREIKEQLLLMERNARTVQNENSQFWVDVCCR